MINKVKLEVCVCVGAGHLGQAGDGFSGQLYHREVDGVGVGQAVVAEIVAKPGKEYL